MITCSNHRGPAPVRSAEAAIRALALVSNDGADPATIVACLDANRRPRTMFVVDGWPAGAGEVELAFRVFLQALGDNAAPPEHVFFGSSRPGMTGIDAADVATWPRLVELGAAAGLVVLDWFVLFGNVCVSLAELSGTDPAW